MNIRSEIHRVVSSIKPLDGVEEQHIRFVLDWIESGSEIFRIEKPATSSLAQIFEDLSVLPV